MVIASSQYVFAGIDRSQVILREIHTVPTLIKVGDIFKINTTVFNGSPVTIKILNLGCMGSLRITFDKNVIIKPPPGLGICVNPHSIINLRPGEHVTLLGPRSNEQFIASSSGITHAMLQIQYQNQVNDQDTGINSRGPTTYTFFFSQSFAFNILR